MIQHLHTSAESKNLYIKIKKIRKNLFLPFLYLIYIFLFFAQYKVKIYVGEKMSKQQRQKSVLKKSPMLYIVLIAIWSILAIVFWWLVSKSFGNVPYFPNAHITNGVDIFANILIVLNAIFISYFWLNGVKDFVYVVWYFVFKKRLLKKYDDIININVSNVKDKILFIYCTCNDFDSKSLSKSIRQNYDNFDVVILDDSTDESYKKKVDAFAQKNNIKVVRRKDRIGFKAGNINHYLMNPECKKKNYKFFVILDSDEILPTNFCVECLKYFYAKENVGIVQANHIATRNRNLFMRLFHLGVNSHWPTYQTMKHFYGFSTMLGHGAMIKSDCYYDAGGFPNLVAEDLCLSIEARDKGYLVAFAPNIVCSEEYPVDYVAFKKRHSKWTQGNLEFIKKYSGKIAKSKMKWFEKLDIVLFTYNLPLTAIFAFYIFLNLMIAPALKINLGMVYPTWLIVPTIVFFFSPTLNDVFTWLFKINFFKFLLYYIGSIVLYGSMLTTSLISATLGIFGKKAKFIVTPKSSQKISFWFALKFQWKEILFSSILITISIIFCKSILPIILIAGTGYLSFFLLFLSNKTYSQQEIQTDDTKTTNIILRPNLNYIQKQKVL